MEEVKQGRRWCVTSNKTGGVTTFETLNISDFRKIIADGKSKGDTTPARLFDHWLIEHAISTASQNNNDTKSIKIELTYTG